MGKTVLGDVLGETGAVFDSGLKAQLLMLERCRLGVSLPTSGSVGNY